VGGRHERVRENQEAFRRANDEIAAAARDLDQDEPTPFLCECVAERCTQVVMLTLEEYEDVRSDAARHVIVPGHAVAENERVLEESDRYWITEEKNGNGVRHTPTSV
jgi:hypothetical protein